MKYTPLALFLTTTAAVADPAITLTPPDATPTPIGPGSYYEIPAHLPHVSACVSDADCVTLLYQDGAFDFVPVR